MEWSVQYFRHFAIPLVAILPLSASYPVRWGRPDKVGTIMLVQAEGKESMTGKGTVGNQPVPFPETNTRITLSYQCEILAANEVRRATRLKVTLGKGTCEINGEHVDLPQEGTVLEVHRENDKKIFLKQGFPLPAPIQNALGLVVELGDGRDESDLQFGTNSPQEVGATWGVNSESILTIAGREIGLIGDPKNVVGKCRLDEVLKDADGECMRLLAHVDIQNVKGAFFLDKEMGLKLDQATVSIDQEGLYPIDTERQPRSSKGQCRFEAKCSGEVGEKGSTMPLRMEITAEMTMNLKITTLSSRPHTCSFGSPAKS